jgi:competence protein ComEC
LPDALASAKEAEESYRWVRRLVTTVYDIPSTQGTSGKRRQTVANLFVGDWTKLLNVSQEEAEIKFRGGQGYVSDNAIGEERLLELYFIDVGQGDSILIQTADDRRILIDGGKDESAYSFIKWKYNLEKYYKDFIVITTHSDADHADGLIPLLRDEHAVIRTIYHNGIAKRRRNPVLGKEEKQDGRKVLVDLYDDTDELKPKIDELTTPFKTWVEAVTKAKENASRHGITTKCIRANNNTEPMVLGENKPLRIGFLNPVNVGTKDDPKLMEFGSDSETVNGNSVAVLLEYGKAKMLLCGDMNDKAERLFLERCPTEAPIAHVFKASHHGSQHFSSEFLKVIQPWITVVSSGDDPDYGHPRACLLGSLGRYAPEIIEKPLLFSTEVAATFKRVDHKSEEKGIHLYEKITHGLINVRTNGEWLAAGRVYNKRKQEAEGPLTKSLWDWERYSFNLKNGKALTDELFEAG